MWLVSFIYTTRLWQPPTHIVRMGAAASARAAELESEVSTLRGKLDQAVEEGASTEEALQLLRGELEKAHSVLLAERLEATRQERIKELHGKALRRLGKRALSRGWSAWLEKYAKHQRHLRMLRGSAARLLHPKRVHAFMHWRRDWEAQHLALLAKGEAVRRAIEAERQRMQREMDTAREKAAAELEERIEMERQTGLAHLYRVFVRRLLQQAKSSAQHT